MTTIAIGARKLGSVPTPSAIGIIPAPIAIVVMTIGRARLWQASSSASILVMARRDRGMTRMEALLDACHKRARPIVMTTIAMGAGMMPIALGIGTDPSFRAPMAIVVIGGLITSTFLSLLVIPVIFTFVDDGVQKLQNAFHRRPKHPPGTPAGPSAGEVA
jgi:Cu/Ag efflux pump CusA